MLMNVRRAIELLDERGSGNDPVMYGGEEIDVSELAGILNETGDASKIRLGYWGISNGIVAFRKHGTLTGMVRDRGKRQWASHWGRKQQRDCPTCGRRN